MRYIRRKTKQWFIPSWKPTGTMTCANESYISMFKDTCQIKQEKTSKNNSSLVTKDHFSDTWSCTNYMTSLDRRGLMSFPLDACSWQRLFAQKCSGINQKLGKFINKPFFMKKFVKKMLWEWHFWSYTPQWQMFGLKNCHIILYEYFIENLCL